MLGDYGDPLNGSTSYRVCVYDQTAGVPVFKMGISVDPGGTCGTKPCWRAISTRGWAYGNRGGNPDGITKVKLISGKPGRPSVQVKAVGSNLPLPAPFSGTEFFDQNPAVLVQLYSSSPANCWSSTFATTGTKRNSPTRFQAKAP